MHKILLGACIVVVAVAAATIFVTMNNKAETSTISKTSATYVALGDSVAAGVGLPTYSDGSACNRTTESYPSKLAESQAYRLTSFACSGATIESGVSGPQTVNNLVVDSQLNQLFATKKTPDVVTLTVGANDINWTQFLACYTTECPAGLASQLAPRLQQLDMNLSSVLERMKQQYGEKMPTVVITGYYGLLARDESSTCSDTAGLDESEKQSISGLFSELNKTLRTSTTRYDFATFADIDFTGHELCSSDPWIQGLADKAPFHPNSAGQTAIAKQLASVIRLK